MKNAWSGVGSYKGMQSTEGANDCQEQGGCQGQPQVMSVLGYEGTQESAGECRKLAGTRMEKWMSGMKQGLENPEPFAMAGAQCQEEMMLGDIIIANCIDLIFLFG